jgi:hypothetical protein
LRAEVHVGIKGDDSNGDALFSVLGQSLSGEYLKQSFVGDLVGLVPLVATFVRSRQQ